MAGAAELTVYFIGGFVGLVFIGLLVMPERTRRALALLVSAYRHFEKIRKGKPDETSQPSETPSEGGPSMADTISRPIHVSDLKIPKQRKSK
jgi:hypothetical protein